MLKMKKNNTVQILTSDNMNLLENVSIADSFFTRLKGLMGNRTLNKQEGLLIRPCNSIHTFFMKMNIDVAFIDREFKVVALYRDMSPWKISKIYNNSYFVIEGKVGSFDKLKIGEKIKIVNKA